MTVARIFVSYRTSDGVDKATALARDLDAAFGAEQVFIDKDDLPAGLPWREAVGSTLEQRPALLLLVTPDTFGARDAQGQRRIDDPLDPVRREAEAALAAGAHLIPLLADGVEALPEGEAMPAPLAPLAERTWRRLRAYDWRDDVERLVADLEALGIARVQALHDRRGSDRRRWLEAALALGLGIVIGAAAMRQWDASAAADPHHALNGTWTLHVAAPTRAKEMRLEGVTLHLTQTGEDLKLYSEPIDVARDPAWAEYAAHWKRLAGFDLDRLVMRGEGQVRLEQGRSPALGMKVRFEMPGVGGDPIESGRLVARAGADPKQLAGRIRLNGEQAERMVEMKRKR